MLNQVFRGGAPAQSVANREDSRGNRTQLIQLVFAVIVGVLTITLLAYRAYTAQQKKLLNHAEELRSKIQKVCGTFAACLGEVKRRNSRFNESITFVDLAKADLGGDKTVLNNLPLPSFVEITDPDITTIKIDRLFVVGKGRIEIKNCPNLKRVEFSGLGCECVDNLVIDECPNLEAVVISFDLEEAQSSALLRIDISNCPEMKTFKLMEDCLLSESIFRVKGISIDEVSAKHLQEVVLACVATQNESINFLNYIKAPTAVLAYFPVELKPEWLPHLERFTLYPSTMLSPSQFGQCKKLESLIMRDFCVALFDASLLPKNIRKLVLFDWEKLTDLSSLNTLCIEEFALICAQQIKDLTPLEKHPTIKKVEIETCSNVESLKLSKESRVESCKLSRNHLLADINLSCSQINSVSISDHPNLKDLYFDQSSQIVGLHIQKCPQLENVGLVMHDHHTFDLVDQENSRPLHALRHYDGMTGTIMSPLDWEKALDRQIQGSRSIPAELKQYLTSPCPFSSGKKVADSHLLVFVPGQISTEGSQRRPFSLEVLKGLAMYSEFSEPVDDIRNDGVGYWIAVGPRDLFEIEFHFEKWCQGEVFTDGNWQKSLVANFPETQHLRRAYSLPNSLEAFAILITLFRCGMHSEFKRQGPDFSYLVNEIVSSDKWRGQTDKRYFVAPKNDESVRRCFLKGEYRLESIATKQSTRNEGRGLVVPVRRWQVDH